MTMREPVPIQWGAQDRFQAHYIVRRDPENPVDYAARTELATRGRLGARRVERVGWVGAGRLASALAADSELNGMIARQPARDAEIYVEPTEGAVRIRGGWRGGAAFGITAEMYRIYDRIAGHVRSV